MDEAFDLEALVGQLWKTRTGAPTPAAAQTLASLLWDARKSGFNLDTSAFVEHIAGLIGPDEDPAQALGSLRAADLALCFACLRGDRVALELLEREHFTAARAAIARGFSALDIDEILQRVRERILMGSAHGGPRLASYAGRGSLRRWIQSVAIRTAQNFAVSSVGPRRSDAAAELDGLVDLCDDPELGAVKQQYREAFRSAVEAAVRDLNARERTLLRLACLDGLSCDAIASIYAVHRATAARWVSAARARLTDRTRAQLVQSLALDPSDLQSLLRLIQSQLDVSMRRFLSSSGT